jgi:PleD family two-component response regulator
VHALPSDDGVEVTVSIGLSSVGPATDVERLRRDADTAMYRSKRGARERRCTGEEPAR